ncbi:MAG: flagellar hook-length control protein FliK [Bacillota bacterium]
MDIRIADLPGFKGPGETLGQLRVGQLVKVEILRFNGPEAVIKVNGMLLKAAVTGTEIPGNVFSAAVESMTPGLIRLKRINQSISSSDHSELSLEELAAKVGINDRSVATALIREMLRWQLPLQPDKLAGLLKELKDIPPEEREDLIGPRIWLDTLEHGESKENIRTVLTLLLGNRYSPEDLKVGENTINRSSTVYQGQENLYCISLHRQGIPGEIFFTCRDPKQNGVNPRQVMIVVRISTKNLGELWVQARIEGADVSIQIASDNEKAASYLRLHLEPLQDMIREAGLHLASMSVTKRKITSVIELMGGNTPLSYTTLDLKV